MELDHRVTRLYEHSDEDARLWRPGRGDLIRLRTWDIFARFLPPNGRVLDVGGGPGAHAAHLATEGYDVTIIEPVPRHVEAATHRAEQGPRFTVCQGIAQRLPAAGNSADAILLMGPLYHLVDRADRIDALLEAKRVLHPGGRLLAEVITRHALVLDAAIKGTLQDTPDGAFWAYFHRPDELHDELEEAGFTDVTSVAVEGFAWLLGELDQRMADPEPLLRAVRVTEEEPSMLGCSAHVIAVTRRPRVV